MHGLAILLAAASVGVDYGWQPTDNGDLEYIIQIEPELIRALQNGEALISEIHPAVSGVRRFRIQIGTAPLPRLGKPTRPAGTGDLSLPNHFPRISDFRDELPSAPAEATRNSTFQLTDDTGAKPNDLPPILSFPGETQPLEPLTATTAAAPPEQPLSAPRPLPDSIPFKTANSLPSQSPTPIPDPDASSRPLNPLPLPTSQALRGNERRDKANSAGPVHSAQQAAFHEKPAVANKKARSSKGSSQKLGPAAPQRPWLLFSLTMLGLLASLGANAYLGYLLLGINRRYQDLREDQIYGTG